ncbi:hypothetical protein LIER_26193 [Lithospermum erythrorhizon]|uniref:Uncharacterized protein n=1 Tax=Lithospermum erythrorhizon TaxID=34254 RepID=A0AAV3R7I2_LITER
MVPDNVIRDQVVEVCSSVSDREYTELLDTGESPECLATKVVESCPPALPTLTIARGQRPFFAQGLPIFGPKAREMDQASEVTSPDSTSVTSQKLSLLIVAFKDQTLEKQCEVQKIEKLEEEAAKI